MNTITHALKTAGVKLPPMRQRIWTWAHDHPGHTSKEIGVALGVKHSEVATHMGNMVKRGMVKSTQTYTHHRRDPMRWHACLPKYELLPVSKTADAKWNPTVNVTSTPPAPDHLPQPELRTERKTIDVHSLKLSEARSLYLQLREYFGDSQREA